MRIAPLACSLLAVLLAAPALGAPQANIYAAAAAAEAKPSSPAQRLERRFLQITAAHLRFQAEASRLAQARSNNPAVRDLANTLVARHESAQPELLRLLHVRGMAPPMMANEHARVLKQLAKLQGAGFDRLYVEAVVLSSYRADIANYEKVGIAAEDPVLKGWAERQLPVLRVHETKAGKALPAGALRGQRTS